MYLAICGDPDCPNKKEVEILEREIVVLKKQLYEATHCEDCHRLVRKGRPCVCIGDGDYD